MNIEQKLSDATAAALAHLYKSEGHKISFEKTNPDFEGDLTLVVFNFLKASRKKPEETAREIGEYLKANVAEVTDFNVIKGFLNLRIADSFWLEFFRGSYNRSLLPAVSGEKPTVLVEYSSPNTNKPLHLGHMRNILLGSSVSAILGAAGYNVVRANLVNDRGIHICKSMLAWQRYGQGETPETSGLKGDHLVGKYYVEFDRQYKKEIADLQNSGKSKEEAEKSAPIMLEVQQMLRDWEAGDPAVTRLWKTMNGWVYSGFDQTYSMLQVGFDKTYYESETYLLGKDIIEEGLQKGVFKKRPDNSIYADLTEDGLDEKTVLRADGTSVYITQDIGTAVLRAKEFNFSKLIHTVGNEQDYHFKVLFLILKKLGYSWAEGMYHLSYGMVELPDGKMKSREGTVVDADELMESMIASAEATTTELGKAQDLSDAEKQELYRIVGLGALKYFILKVDPKKKMLFNPAESIDFNGNTAPFIQFNYVRIRALLRKAAEGLNVEDLNVFTHYIELLPKERELIKRLYSFDKVVLQAAEEYSPALIANYVYELAKEYSQYYHETNILREELKEIILFRLQLSTTVGTAIREGMELLGIRVPERM
jgi:arginyl-tRNA synthetase